MKTSRRNEMTHYSTYDQRNQSDREADLESLNTIEFILEAGISNYALENTEDLFDVDSNEIVRRLDFSQGTRNYSFVICTNGFIRMMQEKCPVELLLDIHNCLMSH